jgi:hypothetical protein
MTHGDIEEPEEDAIEQRQSVADDADDGQDADPADLDDDPLAGVPGQTPLEVDEADAVEQQLTVEIDDGEYR